MLQSKNGLLRRIFETEETTKSTVMHNSTAHAPGKLSFISVGSKFRSQLALLMDKLRSTVSNHLTLSEIMDLYLWLKVAYLSAMHGKLRLNVT